MEKWKSVGRRVGRALQAVRTRLVIVVFLSLLLLMPFGARAQLGLDPCCAIISVGLNTISQLLKSAVAAPLGAIQQAQQQATSFEQQVIYPATAIDQARSLSGQILGQLRQTRQIYQTPTNSATLPNPQQLETVLLSHNSQAMPQIGQLYSAVYGQVMAPTDAPAAVRDQVDMSDAEAQAALKKATQLDALADVELQAADRINQQIQTAAPGSAPILEAQAAAWVVRANAYTQSAYAELIRIRSVDLANAGAQVKLRASGAASLRDTTDQVLQRGVK